MKTIWIAASISALVLGASSGIAYSQGMDIGKGEYLNSCASCHGVTGKGDGSVAKALKRSPADLTKLSEANSGVFPVARVYDVIDGRVEVEAHGQREMPVWGEVYQPGWVSLLSPLPPYYASKETAESIVRGRILALIEYISTLKAK
jgi:mono/diheme cytochrome c family protein